MSATARAWRPRLVVFDVDGTLVDSQHLICAAMDQAFAALNLACPPRQAVLGIVGLSLPQAMLRLQAEADEATVLGLCDAYRRAFGALRLTEPEEALYDGAAAALDALLQRGVVLGIATGKSRRGVARLLERHGLERHFATVRTADDAPSKPHPAMVAQAMAATGIAAADTAMVGDTAFDMAMAVAAGAAGIGVAWGYHPPEALARAGARAVAEDFPGLLAALSPPDRAREPA